MYIESLSKSFVAMFESRKASIILGIACIGIVVFGVFFTGFGFDVNDEAYQTMNAMNPLINPQAILASSISNLYGRIFGFSLHSMRILTFILAVVTIASSTLYFYRRMPERINLAMLLFFTLVATSLCMPVKSRLIGWDCYAVLFTTLSLIAILRIWNGGGYKQVILLGLTAACAILSRFPDVVIVPVGVVAMFAVRNDGLRHGVSRSVVFLVSMILFMTVILGFIYEGDPMQWIVALRENFVSGHSVERLIANYIHTGKFELLDCVALCLFLVIVVRFGRGHGGYVVLALSLFVAVVLGVLIMKIDRIHYPVTRMLTSCIIIMLVVYVVKARQFRWRALFQALVILGCCVTPMAGSDGGTFKFMNTSTIPLVLILLSSIDDDFVVSVSRKMTYAVISACAVVMPFYTSRHTVFDGGWLDAVYSVDHVMLHGNTTTESRSRDIRDMIAEGRKVLPDNVMIIGDNNRRFFSEYLWGSRNMLWPHSWSSNILNDGDKVRILEGAINTGCVEDIAFVKYGADAVDYENNLMRASIEATGKYISEDYVWFVVFRCVR